MTVSNPGGEAGEVTAPGEGSATTRREIADELSSALTSFERVDYNVFTSDELRELLDAQETIEELCLSYRGEHQRKQRERGETPTSGDDEPERGTDG